MRRAGLTAPRSRRRVHWPAGTMLGPYLGLPRQNSPMLLCPIRPTSRSLRRWTVSRGSHDQVVWVVHLRGEHACSRVLTSPGEDNCVRQYHQQNTKRRQQTQRQNCKAHGQETRYGVKRPTSSSGSNGSSNSLAAHSSSSYKQEKGKSSSIKKKKLLAFEVGLALPGPSAALLPHAGLTASPFFFPSPAVSLPLLKGSLLAILRKSARSPLRPPGPCSIPVIP